MQIDIYGNAVMMTMEEQGRIFQVHLSMNFSLLLYSANAVRPACIFICVKVLRQLPDSHDGATFYLTSPFKIIILHFFSFFSLFKLPPFDSLSGPRISL
jgi:hypothetical protein